MLEGLNKNIIKQVTSLQKRKERDEVGLFFAEGAKTVGDLMSVFHAEMIIATSDFFKTCSGPISANVVMEVSKTDLKRVSSLCAPQTVLAVFRKPNYVLNFKEIKNSLSLVLDTIQDPGNLGTIIRIADWFGIENIICSKNCVDVYNPKVVQATMGALSRVRVHYEDLCSFLSNFSDIPIYGTFLNGENIYEQSLSSNGLVIMGNEGNGISTEVETLVNKRLFIPNYPQNRSCSESLNVSVATAIVCSEFRREKK